MSDHTETTMIIAANIKRARGRRTQREIAMASGVPLSTYKGYEGGVHKPGTDKLAMLAKGLGVSVDELVMPPQERDVNQDLRVVFARFAALPDSMKPQVMTTLRAMVLGLEEQASRTIN